MASGQDPSSSSRKRKLTSVDTESILRRTFGNQNTESSSMLTKTGPLYPIEEGSFVLNQRSLTDSQEDVFSENNPHGIVPVVVHPELVLNRNGLKLTSEQMEGIQFLWDLYAMGKGGILAHDLGLGKTRTAITVIATLLQQSDLSKGKSTAAINKAIVIVPLNAVPVWKSEFDKWCPENICKVVSLTSNQKDGWQTVQNFSQSNSLYNVMILSYETFKKYISRYNDGFFKYTADSVGLVICDEAHRLKNSETQLVKTLRQFAGAKLWIGITGTPYQNNLDELCTLTEFFRRDLAVLDLKKNYCKLINDTLRKLKKLSPEMQTRLRELRTILRPCLHYRKNSFNIERHEVLLNIALDGHPDYFQLDEVRQIQHKMYELISEILMSTREITFFEKISYLTKTCIHPEEAYKAIQKHPNVFERAIDYYRENYPEYNEAEGNEKYTALLFSAKIRVASMMVRFIRDKRPGEKIVIVSESTVLLKKIGDFVTAMLKMKCLIYDGDSSTSQRENAVNLIENRDEYRVLLLSEKAGGTALTLTRANHLLILEPDYNPANDWQAFARIYRHGQNKTTFIYRLMCTGTLEEVKLLRQLEKEAMGNTFQAEDDTVDFNVKAPYDEKELIEYFTGTKSHLNDKLDQIVNDDEDNNFALALKKSRKYLEEFQIPNELEILRRNVWESVSHCFHMHKKADPLTQYLLNDDFQIVDGNVVPPM